MRVEEIEAFERKLAKKLVHIAERNYEKMVKREVLIFLFKHMANMARKCEEKFGDKRLGRIGNPT